jgi:hypothetical protein
MVKKLLLIACVVLLVGAVGISDIRAQQQEELAYDDGGDEGQGIAGFVGEVLAVVFTPTQYPAILKRVRIFVNTATPYRLRVYDVADVNSGPTLDLLAGLIQIPTTSGWHTVDLSVYNITINSGQHFAIGVEFLSMGAPLILVDESPPIDNRTWFWDLINWNLAGSVFVLNSDAMIRATVEYLPVITTTTTTEPGGICRVCPILCGLGEGSEETELLRTFRDEVLDKSAEGREIIKLYYQWGPLVARAMEADEEFKEEVTEIIEEILPMVGESIE